MWMVAQCRDKLVWSFHWLFFGPNVAVSNGKRGRRRILVPQAPCSARFLRRTDGFLLVWLPFLAIYREQLEARERELAQLRDQFQLFRAQANELILGPAEARYVQVYRCA